MFILLIYGWNKTTLFSDSDISIPDINHRTPTEVHTWNILVEMCENSIFSMSHWKVIQFKRMFLGDFLELKLRSCSRNNNSVNENKKSYLQIAKTISTDLDICWWEAPNTKQKKAMFETIFETFIQPVLFW